MRHFKILFFAFLLLPFSKTFALTITDTIQFNNKLERDWHQFTFDMISEGYNPDTDSITMVSFTIDIREIFTEPFEDEEYAEEFREPLLIHDWFLFYRSYFPDIDTSVSTDRIFWSRTNDCLYEVQFMGTTECLFQPDIDGLFFSSWQVGTDNLWLNSVSLSIEVIRSKVNEPSVLFIFITTLLVLFGKHCNLQKYS
ncbi:MAG TPA: hypothetical protein VL995_02950 [Cellvibrio sp.]|nr:hypothetical protein [Cellvibrio sp.]